MPQQPASARLYLSVLGVAEPRINGVVATAAKLLPGWSDYRRRAQVVTLDVTSLLHAGSNMLEIVLAAGWYCGAIKRFSRTGESSIDLVYDSQKILYATNFPLLCAQLEIIDEARRRTTVSTDASWRVGDGEVLFSDLYHGETCNLRRRRKRPSVSGTQASEVPAVNLLLQPKVSECITAHERLPAVNFRHLPDGRVIIDFAQVIAGVVSVTVKGRRGSTLHFAYAEMLDGNGELYLANLRRARARDKLVLSGDGWETWSPRFTFHGFRYVEITGLADPGSLADAEAVVWHTPMERTGTFHCSHPLLNRLYENTVWSQRGNFLDVPTDCPQRDERLGWTGDAQAFVATAAAHFDATSFFRKWMKDLLDGQSSDGAVPDIAPDLLGTSGNAGWADAIVICPWEIYRRSGDASILEESYPGIRKWIRYQQTTSANLIRPATSYGDWLSPDAANPDRAPTPSDLIGTAYFARTTMLAAKIAGQLDRRADASKYRHLHQNIRRAFLAEFASPNGRLAGDTQTAYLLALAFDLLPRRHVPRAVQRLCELVRRNNYRLATGFLGTPLLLPVLSRYGQHQLAGKVLLGTAYPSWLYPVTLGATTMWERWNSFSTETGFGKADMNSFNHYAYGAVAIWLYEWLVGIRCGEDAPGGYHLEVQPNPVVGISRASAAMVVASGEVRVRWERSGKKLDVEATIPPNTTFRFIAPDCSKILSAIRDGQAFRWAPLGKYSGGSYRFRLSFDL